LKQFVVFWTVGVYKRRRARPQSHHHHTRETQPEGVHPFRPARAGMGGPNAPEGLSSPSGALGKDELKELGSPQELPDGRVERGRAGLP